MTKTQNTNRPADTDYAADGHTLSIKLRSGMVFVSVVCPHTASAACTVGGQCAVTVRAEETGDEELWDEDADADLTNGMPLQWRWRLGEPEIAPLA
jgi:hypothetical protein